MNTDNKEINRLLNILIDDINFSEDNEENKSASIDIVYKIKTLINR
tara:strand:+ start:670 stop:807 length:138 start_codon:yes stop_codon:yes gene_type:complete